MEVYDTVAVVMEYYGTGNKSLEFPFNFVLLSNGAESTRPSDIKGYVDEWVDALPSGGVSNWVVSPAVRVLNTWTVGLLETNFLLSKKNNLKLRHNLV